MRLDLNHIHTPDKATAERLRRIENMLGVILQNQEEIMATFEELEAAQADTDVKISNLKADIQVLLVKLADIPVAGMTAEQQAKLDGAVTHAQAINDALSAVDAAAKTP